MNNVIESNQKVFEGVTEISINVIAIQNFVTSLIGKSIKTSEIGLFNATWSQSDAFKLTLIFNAMNFCYWSKKDSPKWSIKIKSETLDGSLAFARLLEELGTSNADFLDWNNLAELSISDFKNFFKGSNVEIPLIKERHTNLVTLAKAVLTEYEGDSKLLIQDLDSEKLLEKLVKMDCFKDESIFLEQKVFFWKRAQLEVKMFSDIYESHNHKPLKNIETLTAFADYKVPQLLRHLGILSYSQELAAVVDSYHLIERNSKLENEIRISTVVAVEKIKKFAHDKRLKLTSSQIDSLLWNRATSNKDDMEPYHRTYTTAY